MSKTLLILRAKQNDEERSLIRSALVRSEWNLSVAARELGIRPASLRSRLVSLGMLDEYDGHEHGKSGRPRQDVITRKGKRYKAV
jgi:DNA-binding NtrC family response regulator